ncbi:MULTISPECIES: response regulator [unclassified Pseudomonas]|uniref:response regulator n=1 Tax=unclassified Pseudomonas TaxID=196821 RepID=UPI002810FA32|nr:MULTISPECIES: response regulator [unclassified Pseudomonas]
MHWQYLRVLVVEDHSTYRTLMGWFLQKLGLDHELVCNGQAALTVSTLRHFDLVISDCRMPVMDGYSMAREMRHRERALGRQRIPIIALTANPGVDDQQRCLDAGMDGWLLKPLSLGQLRDVLERWLPRASAAMSNAPALPAQRWPTRAELVETFKDEQVVNQMLHSLRREADEDYAALLRACRTLDKQAAIDCLHRLVGSLVFLGSTGLDARAADLIAHIRDQGIEPNRLGLEQFEQDVSRYLRYLTDL